MPQLYMISKTGEAETITSHYLFALGSYRALYIINWAYRYYTEEFYDWIAIVAGCVQTALYCDFFYLYITKGMFVTGLCQQCKGRARGKVVMLRRCIKRGFCAAASPVVAISSSVSVYFKCMRESPLFPFT